MFGRKSIDLSEAAIAQDQPIFGVEEANALREGVERGLVLQRLRLQLSVLGPKRALRVLKRIARDFRKRG